MGNGSVYGEDGLYKCIPDMSRAMDINTVENLLNRQPFNLSSPQSPDELVIQRRGRRRTIVWSPDLDSYKRHDLLRYGIHCIS